MRSLAVAVLISLAALPVAAATLEERLAPASPVMASKGKRLHRRPRGVVWLVPCALGRSPGR